jgi:Na+:H+ antiporter, NhaC family
MENKKNELTPALALAPILFLIVLLTCSVYLFGADSSYGANQIALLFSAAAVALVGMYLGLSWKEVEQGILHGIQMCLGPLLILISVGMLIGSWILAGTIPAIIYYGVEVLSPSIFYSATAILCAITAVSIGSSWTVAGTIGIGMMAIAASFNMSPEVTAGAIISGAYLGDKLSPLSDTTNLASGIAGVDLFEHIRHLLWTTIPSFILALIAFSFFGGGDATPPEEIAELRQNLARQFDIGWYLFIPLFLMFTLAYRKVPALAAILLSTLVGVFFALVFQQPVVLALAGPSDIPEAMRLMQGVWISLFDGFTSHSGSEFMDKLLSKGGLVGMMNTCSLIICAMAFGGAIERVGILQYLVGTALKHVKSNGGLVAATVGTCAASNVVTSDQFIAITVPGRMFRNEFQKRGLSALNLSRTLEDSATLTSALVPWNTCGAYMAATLGVSTLAYAPFTFFNYFCPIIAVIYGYLKIAQKPLEPELQQELEAEAGAV